MRPEGTPDHLLDVVSVLGTVACVAAGQVLWKLAAQDAAGAQSVGAAMVRSVLLSPWFLSGCLAYAVGVAFWLMELSRFPLSTAFALTAGAVFLVSLAADTLLFSVPFSAMRAAGGGIVFLGIALTIWS